jgi:hypothetical protein
VTGPCRLSTGWTPTSDWDTSRPRDSIAQRIPRHLLPKLQMSSPKSPLRRHTNVRATVLFALAFQPGCLHHSKSIVSHRNQSSGKADELRTESNGECAVRTNG